jgi:Flp pilus assembly protein TadG
MTVVLILVIMGFCGLAIDLSRMYNRKAELQVAANAIALAAAAQLDGTDAGVSRALAAAAQTAAELPYDYNTALVAWSDDAISFAASPTAGAWLDASSTAGNAGNLFYVKVDTSRLDASHGRVNLLLLPVLNSISTSAQVGSRAIAGRSTVNILPFAICAMSPTEGAARGTELVEYGFRRGISYDLMQLNPNGTTKGANFLVNPVAQPGTTGTSLSSRMDVIRPFVCTGTLAMPTVKSGTITVERDFPLSSTYAQLNSRFGTYTSPCTSSTAPPDTNVKAYVYNTALPWMNNVPSGQSAESRTTTTALLTLPDLPQANIPATTTAPMYGPLWLYAKPAKYSAYVPGTAEPANGYPTFSTSDWPTLYPTGTPKIKPGYSYPTPTPYVGSTQAPPGGLKGLGNRRVLNVPLLSCPVPAGSPAAATVLAIGRFFMTVPATDHQLFAEFAGLAQQSSLVGPVELYP